MNKIEFLQNSRMRRYLSKYYSYNLLLCLENIFISCLASDLFRKNSNKELDNLLKNVEVNTYYTKKVKAYMMDLSYPVRLKKIDIQSLIFVFQKYFDPSDQIWIFGSRADLTKKGGDLDLYIETAKTDRTLLFQKKLHFLIDLKKKIGDQKIDLVIKTPDSEESLIFDEAKNHGVQIL